MDGYIPNLPYPRTRAEPSLKGLPYAWDWLLSVYVGSGLTAALPFAFAFGAILDEHKASVNKAAWTT